MLHLRQRTKGEAYDIVSKVPLEDSGFEIAWRKLYTRFQNKRALVTAEARKLFELPTVAAENAKDLEILHRKINSCTSNLEMYGIDTSNWDLIFILLCSDKLPASTVTLWEQTLVDKTAIPKWSHFNEFLYERFRTLESVAENRICESSGAKSNITSV